MCVRGFDVTTALCTIGGLQRARRSRVLCTGTLGPTHAKVESAEDAQFQLGRHAHAVAASDAAAICQLEAIALRVSL